MLNFNLMFLIIKFSFIFLLINNLKCDEAIIEEVEHKVEILNGDAVVTVTIPKLKGINNLTPNIDLVYKSSQYLSNNEIGSGWSINGLSLIQRSQYNFYAKYNYEDIFLLDGLLLISIDGKYGFNGSEYRCEVESFKKIISYGTSGMGPLYFKVFSKDNLIYTYGQTEDSRYIPEGSINPTIGKWFLSKIEDYSGNAIQYTYYKSGYYTYLSEVKYSNRKISFSYIDRAYQNNVYINRTIFKSVNKLLNKVTLSVDENVVKYLLLEYKSPSENLVRKIITCYSSKESRCTKPLLFEYDHEINMNAETSFRFTMTKSAICGKSAKCELKQMADMNGDGRLDIVAFGDDGVYVSLNMGDYFEKEKIWTGEFSKLNGGWNSDKYLRFVIDVNKDKLPDIVGFGENGVYVGLNAGASGFIQPAVLATSYYGYRDGWTLSNLRYLVERTVNDLPFIYAFSSNGVFVSIPSFSNNIPKYLYSLKLADSFYSNEGWGNLYPVFLTDIDADGIKDIVGFGPKTNKLKSNIFTGNSISINGGILDNIWEPGKFPKLFVDINADNIPDVFGLDGSGNILIGYSRLDKDYFACSVYNRESFLKNTNDKFHTVADINADGLLDVVLFDCDGIYVSLNSYTKGNQMQKPSLWPSDLRDCKNKEPKFVVDVNGDGLADVVEFSVASVKIGINQFKKAKLTRITDSFGGVKTINYDLLINRQLNTFDSKQENIFIPPYSFTNADYEQKLNLIGYNFDVVSSFSIPNGVGGISTIEYKYKWFSCIKAFSYRNLYGSSKDGLCSFAFIHTKAKNSNVYTLNEYYLEFPLTGILKSRKTYAVMNANNEILLNSKNYYYNSSIKKYNYVDYVYKLELKRQIFDYFDHNGNAVNSEISEFIYDQFGNVEQLNETTVNKLSSSPGYLSKITKNLYKPDEKNWYLNRPKLRITIHALVDYSASSSISNSSNGRISNLKVKKIIEKYDYDINSRLLLKHVRLADEKIGLETKYVYSSRGNLIETYQRDLSTREVRQRSFRYDNKTEQYLIESYNELKHKTIYSYDLMDNLVQIVDPNGQITLNKYTENGKKIYEFKPGFSNNSWSLEWDTSMKNSLYSITTLKGGGLKSKNIYDSLHRIIRTINYGFKPGSIIYQDTIYNEFGLVVNKTYPYKLNSNTGITYVLFNYDFLLRETSRIEINLDKIKYHYTEYLSNDIIYKSLVDNNNNNNKTLINNKIVRKNYLGQIASVENSLNSKSFYYYDQLNNLVRVVDAQGVETKYEYNLNNKIIKTIDLYSGTYTNEYNSFDELTMSDNGKFKIIYDHDLMGRLVNRTEPEGTTIWTYDSSPNAIGFIHYINSTNSSKEFYYDSFNREIELVNRLKGEDLNENSFSIRTTYDEFGRISSKIYPSSSSTSSFQFRVFYCFNNQNGYLNAISLDDSKCLRSYLWKANDYHVMNNRVLSETTQNGIQTDYKYNDFNQITEIFSYSTKSKKTYRNYNYDYDLNKNLAMRVDHDFRNIDYIQKFSYDYENRLKTSTQSEIKLGVDRMEKITKLSEWNYDSIGSIVYSNDELKNQYYKFDSKKPQQAIQIGSEEILYDNYGRVSKTSSYEIDWYSFSQPKTIKSKSNNCTYEYGPDRDRIAKTSLDSRVVYIENLYEKHTFKSNSSVNLVEKYFIYAMGRVIALKVVLNKKEDNLFFINQDPFGFIDSIMDSDNGFLLAKYNYTAFGFKTTMFSNLTADLDKFLNFALDKNDYINDRLILFKGRIYDTIYARFLSPDPFVQDPYNIDNLNRYNYNLNNPFKFKDPSGNDFFSNILDLITNPLFIITIIATVLTAGALSGLATSIATSITTNTVLSSVISGAIVGAGTGFTSTLILTGGNLNAALKGALVGGISGGISAGLTSGINALNTGFSKTANEFISKTLFDGGRNLLEGKNFFDGIGTNIATSFAQSYFNFGGGNNKPGPFMTGLKAFEKIGGITNVPFVHDIVNSNFAYDFSQGDENKINKEQIPLASFIIFGTLYSAN